MPTNHRAALAAIKTFPQLIVYLRDEMGWPIAGDDFEDLTFEYTPEELGIDTTNAAKIQEIKRLRPLSARQPWGIFFVKFEPKKLPVVALRRILSRVALKKRASANSTERAAWAADDLLFISNYGEGAARHISFAHFSMAADGADLPTLKVLGWDNLDTALHLDMVARELTEDLAWPDNQEDLEAWRSGWRGAFTLRHGEVVTTSRELSIRLAKLAGDIRDRIKSALAIETDRGPLTKLMTAFQTSLVHDLDADGFADMYAQTIAYGLLSARIADPTKKTVDDFGAHMRTNPFLRELMETFLKVGGRRGKAGGSGIDFDELGVGEVVQLLDHANMEAVVLDFGDKNPQEDPVIHFYELFLKEYDAKKRMQRGVFYTPRPVVSYIVRSVDELLRTEFGLEDGLADTTTWGEMAKRHKDLKIPEGVTPDQDFVQILDPATGTGTFLVEVIDIIHKTMAAKWKALAHSEKKIAELWNEYVPRNLLTRLHAYELLMAPYAIAHLKVGLKLYETGYRFGSDERARIYLTNALEPASDSKMQVEFAEWLPALAHEAQAVNEIKQGQRFTLIIGNPPYSDASQNLGPQFARLVEPFRFFQGERIRERGAIRFEHVINNDYVKFWGLSVQLLSAVPVGAVCLITSNSYLGGKSFRGVRDAMLLSCSHLRVTDLHGEGWSGELARAGKVDENVFEIQTGVAVCQLVKNFGAQEALVEYADVAGTYAFKAEALAAKPTPNEYVSVPADLRSYRSFLPSQGERHSEYWQFPQLDSLFIDSVDGIKSSRDGLVIANSYEECLDKLKAFGSGTDAPHEVEARLSFEFGKLVFDEARRHVKRTFDSSKIHKIAYRPFDIRYIYYDRELILSHRMNTMPKILGDGAQGIVCASRLSAKGFDHALAARSLCSNKYSSHDINSRMFLVVSMDSNLSGTGLFSGIKPECLAKAKVPADMAEVERARLFGNYVLAILNAPSYRARFFEDIQQDFPRIPYPNDVKLLKDLGMVGASMADAHCLALEVPTDRFVFHGTLGEACVAPRHLGSRLWIGKTSYVEGVSEELWGCRLAGYQICSSWFSAGGRSGLARKNSRIDQDLVNGLRQVLWCAAETLRLRSVADNVIEQYGGWPGAFASAPMPQPDATEPGEVVGSIPPSYPAQSLPVRKVAERRSVPGLGVPRPSEDDSTDAPDSEDDRPYAGDLMWAVRAAIQDRAGTARAEATRNLVRLLDGQFGSRFMVEIVEEVLSIAARRGIVSIAAGRATRLTFGIADYERAELKRHFLAALPGRSWVERPEAIRRMAAWLGFRRTGSNITKAGKSIINGLLREGRLEARGSEVRRA